MCRSRPRQVAEAAIEGAGDVQLVPTSKRARAVAVSTASSSQSTTVSAVPQQQSTEPSKRKLGCIGTPEYNFIEEVYRALGAAGLLWEESFSCTWVHVGHGVIKGRCAGYRAIAQAELRVSRVGQVGHKLPPEISLYVSSS